MRADRAIELSHEQQMDAAAFLLARGPRAPLGNNTADPLAEARRFLARLRPCPRSKQQHTNGHPGAD